jgi:hypothetical protein
VRAVEVEETRRRSLRFARRQGAFWLGRGRGREGTARGALEREYRGAEGEAAVQPEVACRDSAASAVGQ